MTRRVPLETSSIALALALAAPLAAQTATPAPASTAPTATPAEQQTSDQGASTRDATVPAAGSAAGTPAAADIVVTGSRIRGIQAVGSNVIALSQDKIAQEPVTSTSDLLRRVPQVLSLGANRNGGTAQNGAANATRGAGINLRGIGTNATLLLYNGRRFPPQGTQGQYTDPSVLPTIALGRVEVVADGASAIYGSDAIAGVVNFILRKNFEGFEAKARAGFTDGQYYETQASAIIGKRWDGGGVMIAGEYAMNSALRGFDLPWYQDDNRYRGGRDLRTTFCNPGTITAGGGTYAIPAGGVTAANVGTLVRGTSNRCYYQNLDSVIPEQKRESVVASIEQTFGGVRVFADGFYSHRDGVILGTTDTVSAVVPRTNPFFVSPVAGATSVTVAYHLLPELGPDVNPYRSYSYNLTGGVEAKLFSDWKGTVYYAHGESKDIADRRKGVNAAALATALADTNPLTALNVFGGVNNPATLARINDNYFQIIGRTKLDVVNAQADGSLFELPGGAVRLAIGGEYRREYTFTNLVTGNTSAQTQLADSGSRNVKAAFGELYVPIVGAGNAMTGIQQLALSVAGRFEHYSDFGNTTNPKIGLTYKPIDGFTLKGSYGTSFRAPTFTEVSTRAGGAGLYFDTLPDTASATGTSIGLGIAGGNPSLKPETARTWSVGGQVTPLQVPGLQLDLTYFDINYKNQIQALRGTAGILNNPVYASFVTRNPTQAQVAALIASGLPINSAINPALVTFIVDGRRQNLGQSLVRGLDFGINYQRTFGAWKADAGVQGTYYTKYAFKAVPGAAYSDVLNTINFPQRFRMQSSLGLTYAKLHFRVTENHLSGYQNNTVAPIQHIKAYDTVDFYLAYDLTRAVSVSVDVRNAFDRDPPFVDITRGYDPQSANPVPRLVSFNVGVKF